MMSTQTEISNYFNSRKKKAADTKKLGSKPSTPIGQRKSEKVTVKDVELKKINQAEYVNDAIKLLKKRKQSQHTLLQPLTPLGPLHNGGPSGVSCAHCVCAAPPHVCLCYLYRTAPPSSPALLYQHIPICNIILPNLSFPKIKNFNDYFFLELRFLQGLFF